MSAERMLRRVPLTRRRNQSRTAEAEILFFDYAANVPNACSANLSKLGQKLL